MPHQPAKQSRLAMTLCALSALARSNAVDYPMLALVVYQVSHGCDAKATACTAPLGGCVQSTVHEAFTLA
jgi:hypothetical protein